MSESHPVRIGLAGWGNPPDRRAHRGTAQSHLAYYAEHFSCVEINSSFYRSHQDTTYLRWRDETSASFRFSVKMPRTITHESQLRRCAPEVERFFKGIAHLQPKLAVVLIQLPPSLEYNGRTTRAFLKNVPRLKGTELVCEPRHASWFSAAADNALREAGVSRVAADPARCQDAELPGGNPRFAYFRWHGSPRVYYSTYTPLQLRQFAESVVNAEARATWCIFDNTARHAAWDNAVQFMRMRRRHTGARAAR